MKESVYRKYFRKRFPLKNLIQKLSQQLRSILSKIS